MRSGLLPPSSLLRLWIRALACTSSSWLWAPSPLCHLLGKAQALVRGKGEKSMLDARDCIRANGCLQPRMHFCCARLSTIPCVAGVLMDHNIKNCYLGHVNNILHRRVALQECWFSAIYHVTQFWTQREEEREKEKESLNGASMLQTTLLTLSFKSRCAQTLTEQRGLKVREIKREKEREREHQKGSSLDSKYQYHT